MPKIAAQLSHLTPLHQPPTPADHAAERHRARLEPHLPPCSVVSLRAPLAPAPALPAPEPMRGSDKVFLHMGNFVCTGLLTFPDQVPRADVLQVVKQRLLKMERFSQRVDTPKPGAEMWQPVRNFSPEAHVQAVSCRGGADSPELMALVDSIIAQPLNLKRPLWDMTVIHCGDGKTVLLTRVHHAVADGMRLMQAVLQCDDDPTRLDTVNAEMSRAIAAARAKRPAQTGVLGAVASWAGSACQVGNTAVTFAQMVARRADPMTSLKDGTEVIQAVAGSMPAWPVDDIKALAHALGGEQGTVNDVMLTLLTGALRRLFLQRGDKVDGLTVRCLQAVNMLPVGNGKDLGNSVGSAMVPLPIHAATPRARFNACQAHNQALKSSAEPVINAAMLGYMGGLPEAHLKSMFHQVSSQATCAMSNIRGPAQKLHLLGHEVSDVRWFVSAIGNIGVFAPVISYAGKLRMCLQLDRKLNLPIRAFEQAVAAELVELQALAAQG